jgi:peptidylprolyl isomerase
MPSRSVPTSTRTFSKNQLVGILIVALVLAIVAGYVLFGRKTYVTTPSGLKYRDQVVGTGDSPKPGGEVVVHYTGKLQDGTKFDSSLDRNQPFTTRIGVGAVIKGWDEGIMTMRAGGKRQLIIPPDLGYGTAGSGTIPPNATLLFDVELLKVK